MRADSREENSSSLGRDGGDGTSTPTPLNVCPQRVLTCLKYLPLGEKPWKVPLWKGKNWTSISIFWHKFLSSWRMVSVGCQCHSLEERNLTCDQKWGKCTLQAQDFCLACYEFVGFEFFFFLMNLIIQVWILEQILWYGVSWGMQRLSCSFPCVQTQLWGNSFCPDYQIFEEMSKIIFSFRKYVSLCICTTVICFNHPL